MGFLLPFLILGGVLIAVTASKTGSGGSAGGIPIPPSMGPGDVINIVDPSERIAVWKALISTTATAAQMDTLAAVLTKEGYLTAAARAAAKAASIRASSGGIIKDPTTPGGGGVTIRPTPGDPFGINPVPGGGFTIRPTPGNPFGINPRPAPAITTPQEGPIPEPLRTQVFTFMATHRNPSVPDPITGAGTDLLTYPAPTGLDLAELQRLAYTYPQDWLMIRNYIFSFDPTFRMPSPPLPDGIPYLSLQDPAVYFAT